LTDIDLDLDNSNFAVAGATETVAGAISNLYIKYGPSNNMITTSIKGTAASTDNLWSINYLLKKGETIYFEVYATLDTTIDATDTVRADLDVNGTTVGSSIDGGSTEASGQTITAASGTFTEFNDDHPVAAIVAGNQEVSVAKYRFSASNDNYTIKELKTSTESATAAGLVNEVRIYDGSTLIASTIFDEDTNTSGTFTGLSIPVAANASKTLTVKYLLGSVGVGAGVSQTDVKNTLESVKIANSNGTEVTETGVASADWTVDTIIGNSQYVFASIPTISAVDLTNSTLVNGQATDLYKFTVAASSSGSISLKQFKLTTTWSDGGTADTLEVESLKLYKNGSDIT
ncbi:MAG: hypothetical protein AAB431_03370, partial [Patescibacteria group bacterium]